MGVRGRWRPRALHGTEIKRMSTAVEAGPRPRLAIWRRASALALCALVAGLASAVVPSVAAAAEPSRQVEVIVQLEPAGGPATGRDLLRAADARDVRELPIVH